MRKVCILALCLLGILFTSKISAQCSATVKALNNCLPVKLQVSSTTVPARVIWKKGTTTIATNYLSWGFNPDIIIGSYTSNPIEDGNKIFVDANENVYISYPISNGRVEKWLPGASSPIVVAGNNGQGSGNNQLKNPHGIFVDGAGNLYVADAGNNRVMKWAPGAVSGSKVAGGNGSGNANNQLGQPKSVFVDNSGNVYVSDLYINVNIENGQNDRVMKWAPGATTGVKVAGGNGQGSAANQLLFPDEIWVTSNGTLYIADGNGRIQRWAAGATTGVTVGSNSETGLLRVDDNGIIYGMGSSGNITRWIPGSTTGTPVLNKSFFSNTYMNGYHFFLSSSGDLYGLVKDATPGSGNGVSRIFKFPNNTDLTYVATSGGGYTATVINFKACSATSAEISVSSNSSPIIDISAVETTICSGSSGEFSSTSSNFGALPQYVWKKNSTIIATNTTTFATADILDRDTIRCILTNTSNGCFAADSIVMRVQPVPSAMLLSNGNCIPSVLSLNSNETISEVRWMNNENWLDTARIDWNPTSSIIKETPNTNSIRHLTLGKNDTVYIAYQVSSSNNVIVNYQVERFSPGSTTGVLVAGGNGVGTALNQLSSISSLFVDDSANIYIADANRIVKWKRGAEAGEIVLSTSGHLFVDKQGNIYVSNNNAVTKWTPNGASKQIVAGGSTGSGASQLSGASAIYVDEGGSIYVLDNGNYRVQKFTPGNPDATTVAGGNGSGNAANQIGSAVSIAVDASGTLYVSGFNNMLRWLPGATSGEIILGDKAKGFTAISSAGILYVGFFHSFKKFTPKSFNKIINSGGDYSAIVRTMDKACPMYTALIQVNALPSPLITLTQNGHCEGSNVIFTADTANAGNANFQWQIDKAIVGTGKTYTSATLADSTILTCTVTNASNSCTITDSLRATIDPPPIVSLSASIGLPSTVTINSNRVLPQIAWSYNGAALDTTHNWKENAVTVATSTNTQQGLSGIALDNKGGFYTVHPELNTTGVLGSLKKWTIGSATPTVIASRIGFHDVAIFGDSLFVSNHHYSVVSSYSLGGVAGGDIAGRYGLSSKTDSTFNSIYQIAIDAERNLYVTDWGNHRVMKWARGAKYGTRVAGSNAGSGPGADQMSGFNFGIALDEQKNIYSTESLIISKWQQGVASKTIIADLKNITGNIYGITRDPLGNIYASGTGGVLKVATNGQVMYVAGNKGNGNASNQFKEPREVELDTAGNMFVVDNVNYRVQMFTADTFKTRQVSNAGLYKVHATAFNGCAVTDSVQVFEGSYTFNGNSNNWNDPVNWANNTAPPAIVPEGYLVVIDPLSGECILDGNLTVSKGAVLRVVNNKQLIVNGNLNIR